MPEEVAELCVCRSVEMLEVMPEVLEGGIRNFKKDKERSLKINKAKFTCSFMTVR